MGEIYTIKRIENSNFTKESVEAALKSERITELMKYGRLMCELYASYDGWVDTLTGDMIRFQCIDPLNACARVIEINDDNIKIELLEGPISDYLKELLEVNINALRAHIRALSKPLDNGLYEVHHLITFDIIYHYEFE